MSDGEALRSQVSVDGVNELVQLLRGEDLDFDQIEECVASVVNTSDRTLQPVLEGHLCDFVDTGDWYARDEIARLLYEICGVDALLALLKAMARDLGDDQDSLAGMVVDLFGTDRVTARSAALDCAASAGSELRRIGVWALGFVGTPADQELIVGAAADMEPQIRSTAMGSISRTADRDPRVAEVLRAGTCDPDPQVRVSAIDKLGWHRVPSLVPLIAACAEDPEPRVRTFVAHALGRITEMPDAARGILEVLAGDRDVRVRDAAQRALAAAARTSFRS